MLEETVSKIIFFEYPIIYTCVGLLDNNYCYIKEISDNQILIKKVWKTISTVGESDRVSENFPIAKNAYYNKQWKQLRK